MAIKLEMGELYGMNSIDEVMQTISDMQMIGMSDEDIQAVLDRSKGKEKDKWQNAKPLQSLAQ